MKPVKDNKIKKPSPRRSLSRSRSGLRLSKHHRERAEHEDEEQEEQPDELPLVERTNALSIPDFVSRYIDPARLHVQITTTAAAAASTTTAGETTGETPAEIHIYSAATIPSLDFESCFSLIEQTSAEDYKASSMGWSPSKKRKEMRLPDMRYMVLRGRLPPELQQQQLQLQGMERRHTLATTNTTTTTTANNSNNNGDGDAGDVSSSNINSAVLGFLSFMTTYEDSKEVLYCYEIHIHPSLQGQGIGRKLMDLFEEIGRRIQLEKLMLTVFKRNLSAVQFYGRLGYEIDEFSPGARRLRNGTVKEPDYLILSKGIK